MTAAPQAVFEKIAEYATAIAFQAGVGSSETAGVIVSFLVRRPELLAAFMRDELSATDSGMLDHHNGALTWHGADGNVYGPYPSKARFPAERQVAPIAFDLATFTSDAGNVSTSEVEPEDIRNGAVDARLWWFLHVLAACGTHGTAANDYNGEWVAAFCGDFHPTDTFNRACNLKLALCTHNSMDETSRIWVTEAGRAWVAERSSLAAKEAGCGLR